MKLENKTIIVTGGGNGMGRELVFALLDLGARVLAIDINPGALEETFRLSKTKHSLYPILADITDPVVVELTITSIIKTYGSVDVLINNAGIIQPFIKFNDLDFGTIQRVFNVNFFGTLYMTKALLPHLLKRPEAHIVNMSSMGGFLPVPAQSIYCSAKAAVKMMTESLSGELNGTSVGVTVVFPGAIRTNIKANSGLKVEEELTLKEKNRKITSPRDASLQIIQGILKGKKRVFIGPDAKIMDFLYRLRPGFASNLIYKKMKDKLFVSP